MSCLRLQHWDLILGIISFTTVSGLPTEHTATVTLSLEQYLRVFKMFFYVGWRLGLVVTRWSRSTVILRWARLVPGWVTIFGRVNYLGM